MTKIIKFGAGGFDFLFVADKNKIGNHLSGFNCLIMHNQSEEISLLPRKKPARKN